MDTNLLDTCKEARFEIEEAQPSSREAKFQGSQLHVSEGDSWCAVAATCCSMQTLHTFVQCMKLSGSNLAKSHTTR